MGHLHGRRLVEVVAVMCEVYATGEGYTAYFMDDFSALAKCRAASLADAGQAILKVRARGFEALRDPEFEPAGDAEYDACAESCECVHWEEIGAQPK